MSGRNPLLYSIVYLKQNQDEIYKYLIFERFLTYLSLKETGSNISTFLPPIKTNSLASNSFPKLQIRCKSTPSIQSIT